MLAGTVEFYDNFLRVKFEMDIDDFDSLSLEDKFKLILEKDIIEVIISGYYTGSQLEPSKRIFFSNRS